MQVQQQYRIGLNPFNVYTTCDTEETEGTGIMIKTEIDSHDQNLGSYF